MYGLPDFTVGGAIRQTWDILKRHAGLFLVLGLLLGFLPRVATLLALLQLGPLLAEIKAGSTPETNRIVTIVLSALLPFIGTLLGAALLPAAVVRIAHEGLYGRRASLGDGLWTGLRFFFPNLLLTILMSLGEMLGAILLFVPAIMLMVRWSVAHQALVVESAGVMGGFHRSRDLTSGHRWSIFGFVLIVAVVVVALSLGLGVLGAFGVGFALDARSSALANGVIGTFAQTLAAMVSACAYAAVYFELRRAGEGALSRDVVDAFS